MRIRCAAVAAFVLVAAGRSAGADAFEFQSTGSLVDGGRDSHAAVLLADGRVLVVGGYPDSHSGAKSSAERYDPTSGTWTSTGSLATARTLHTATRLPDGRVLVAGGTDEGVVYETTEIYDPATGTFSAGASMSVPRQLHRAVALADGRVLVVGGTSGSASPVALTSAEIYDPVTETWSATGSMAFGRNMPAVVRLADGRVLVAGGSFGPEGDFLSLAGCEVYDPTTGTFEGATPMLSNRSYAGATLLADGRVLVAGGVDGTTTHHSAEVCSPGAESWSSIAGTTTAGGPTVTATLLPDGRVLLAGGFDASGFAVESGADLFDPAANTHSAIGPMNAPRHFHSATRLANGSVLLAGGAETLSGPGPYAGSTAEFFVVDTTPPVISSVSDVHADATSTLGAVVTFTAPTATDDFDGAVTVTCVPASGSLFEVGITEVVCSASDSSGNTASATFDVIVRINSQSLKGAAAQTLNALLPTGDKQTDRLLLKAIKDIQDGLAPEHWADDLHLTSQGRAAFREDSQAIQRLLEIVAPSSTVLQVIADLVAADRVLAETAIADATASNPESTHLATAAAEMALAADSLAADAPADAVRHYRAAWKSAMKASGLL